ncbi:uncharacterized protein [Macrobrachium rosenbergii]|uniref:uncharacterized protein n=1 Tax=Macrobrachium rosenbergii TaxID=79674 RepID=UPI0034D67708
MGCGESKDVQRISSSDAQKKLQSSLKGLDVVRISSASSSSSGVGSGESGSAPNSPEEKLFGLESEDSLGHLPTTLENIPNSDLGESLDCRRGGGGNNWYKTTKTPPTSSVTAPNSSSARSQDSSDSGIYDLDDDYSFVITENSPPELVKRVIDDFTPIENLDLTLTGKQCPRLLSGYQKARQEEAEILASLREEGFISTSRQRAGGGMAFEIIEATPATESASSSKFKPKDFLPQGTKDYLESQRTKHQLKNFTPEDVEQRMQLAEERRLAEIAAKKEKMVSLYKNDAEEKKSHELRDKLVNKKDAALEKREAHLKELRDKLKEKNKKIQQVKLKKLINGPPVPIPVAPSAAAYRDRAYDDFFN